MRGEWGRRAALSVMRFGMVRPYRVTGVYKDFLDRAIEDGGFHYKGLPIRRVLCPRCSELREPKDFGATRKYCRVCHLAQVRQRQKARKLELEQAEREKGIRSELALQAMVSALKRSEPELRAAFYTYLEEEITELTSSSTWAQSVRDALEEFPDHALDDHARRRIDGRWRFIRSLMLGPQTKVKPPARL